MDQLWQSYQEIPVVTRTYVTACALTTLSCQLHFINPFQLYFNLNLILEGQVWRLLTNFLYFGSVGLDFMFHMFFLVRYCKMLEEGSFRNRPADFCFMLMFGAFLLLLIAPLTNVFFLGSALTFMMVYVWGRRNKFTRMSFLGLFTFTAPYLPWVLLGFSLLIGQSIVIDLLGILVGHVYYYLEDFYPSISGRRLLKTPRWLKRLLEDEPEPPPPVPVVPGRPVLRPGGFDWGGDAAAPQPAQAGQPAQEQAHGDGQGQEGEDTERVDPMQMGGLRQRQRQRQQEEDGQQADDTQ